MENAFRDWLEQIDKRPVPQIRDNVSRARRIEKEMSIDLDNECSLDRCEHILGFLDINNLDLYSYVGLPKDKNGLASLKTAVRKYLYFWDWKSI